MQEQVVYEMVCAMLRERWGAGKVRPKLRLVGGSDVKQTPATESRRVTKGWNRPHPLDRIKAIKAEAGG